MDQSRRADPATTSADRSAEPQTGTGPEIWGRATLNGLTLTALYLPDGSQITHTTGGTPNPTVSIRTFPLNQLTTPDPLLNTSDAQSFNPYAYSRNNPIALGDPSGLQPDDCLYGCDRTEGHNSSYTSGQYGDGSQYPGQTGGINNGLNSVVGTGTCGGNPVTREEQVRLLNAPSSYPETPSGWDEFVGNLKAVSYEIFVADFVRCGKNPGINGSCGWAASTFIPFGKLPKIGKTLRAIDDLDEARMAANAADDALRGVDDVLGGLSRGKQSFVRTVPDEAALNSTFDDLAKGGVPTTWKNFRGRVIERSDGVQVGIRDYSRSGGPTIDIRMPDGKFYRIHVDQ